MNALFQIREEIREGVALVANSVSPLLIGARRSSLIPHEVSGTVLQEFVLVGRAPKPLRNQAEA